MQGRTKPTCQGHAEIHCMFLVTWRQSHAHRPPLLHRQSERGLSGQGPVLVSLDGDGGGACLLVPVVGTLGCRLL